MEDYEQNENRLASARIHPKKVDVLLVSNLFLVCAVALVLGYLRIVHERQIFMASGLLICSIFLYAGLLQRVSVDSRKLRYYIFGLIPVEIYWYEVAQIGIVRFPNRGSTSLMGEMFAIVLKPCKKYEEGHKELHHLHPSPKWRHPFLVKNIYCDTEKYKGIIEEYSRKKVSFERIYY